LDALAILALPDRFVMFDPLATPDTCENACFFIPKFRRKEDGDRLTNGFLGRKAKQLHGTAVPNGDNSVQVFVDDGVVGGLHDGGELLGMALI
jgi:hypothetical protein